MIGWIFRCANSDHFWPSSSHVERATRNGAVTSARFPHPENRSVSTVDNVAELLPIPGRARILQRSCIKGKCTIFGCQGRGMKSRTGWQPVVELFERRNHEHDTTRRTEPN